MTYTFDFSAVWQNFGPLLKGCLLTLEISIGAVGFAFLLAIGPAMLLHAKYNKTVSMLINVFVEAVRNTPFLVQLYFLFFGLPAMGVRLSPMTTAVVALTINGTAYAIEIIRGGLESIHKGQIEAGLALGMHPVQVFMYVVLKSALRVVYPSLTSQFIFLMLASSIASSITANELTSVAANIESTSFRSFEIYFVVAGLYLGMSILLSGMFGLIHRMFFAYPSR
jgi:polar amino acid transport system permease protein